MTEPDPYRGTGLGPLADLQLVASMLASQGQDIASLARLLGETLAGVLPAGMVEIARERSLGDRMAGRPGKPVSVEIHGAAGDFALSEQRGRVVGEFRRTVNDVVISRQAIGVPQWIELLAGELRERATQDAAARAALGRLLGH